MRARFDQRFGWASIRSQIRVLRLLVRRLRSASGRSALRDRPASVRVCRVKGHRVCFVACMSAQVRERPFFFGSVCSRNKLIQL
jgi:hypothetical protein